MRGGMNYPSTLFLLCSNGLRVCRFEFPKTLVLVDSYTLFPFGTLYIKCICLIYLMICVRESCIKIDNLLVTLSNDAHDNVADMTKS